MTARVLAECAQRKSLQSFIVTLPFRRSVLAFRTRGGIVTGAHECLRAVDR
jgi:hypothetical protein